MYTSLFTKYIKIPKYTLRQLNDVTYLASGISEVEWFFFIPWKNCESWSVSEFYIHSFQSLVNTFKKMSGTSKMMWYDFHPMSYMCYLNAYMSLAEEIENTQQDG